MSNVITVKFTGLTALVRHQKQPARPSHVMDTIMVRPLHMKMGNKTRTAMSIPEHFPLLIADKCSVRLDPPDLLPRANATTFKMPDDTDKEAWLLTGFELRFPGAPKHARPVTHARDRKSPGGTVTCHDLDDFKPLSMIPNVTEAGEVPFDRRWLGRIRSKTSPVGARVRLSGGSIACESTGHFSAAFFWELTSLDKAFPGRPMAEIVVLSYPVPVGQCCIKLDVVKLGSRPSDKPAGAVYLSVGNGAFEFRNFPKPRLRPKFKIGNGKLPGPVDHFDAFYDLLSKRSKRPIPHYWGRSEVDHSARKLSRLVLASDEGLQKRPVAKNNRTGDASCPLGVFMV